VAQLAGFALAHLLAAGGQRVVIDGETATVRGLTAPAELSAVDNEDSAPAREPRGRRNHWCKTFVDGVDDLGISDPAKARRRDREVGMPEPPLDDQ
jgi:hypothetical protein